MEPAVKNIEKEDFFIGLLDDLESIIIERGTNIKTEEILMKHEMGTRLIESKGDAKRFGYGDNYIPLVAKKLNCHASSLYHCMKFADTFPVWEEVERRLPKNATWNYVLTKMLKIMKEPSNKQKKYSIDEVIKILFNCIEKEVIRDYGGNVFKVIENPEMAREILRKFIKKLNDEKGAGKAS